MPLSQRFVFSKYLKMTNEELKLNELMWLQEKNPKRLVEFKLVVPKLSHQF